LKVKSSNFTENATMNSDFSADIILLYKEKLFDWKGHQVYKLKSAVFSQKNAFFFPRKQKQIYSKYLPSLTIHFPHLSGNLCIPRQKNSSSFEANHFQATHQAIFGRLRKNRTAVQRARGPSTKTGDSQKVPDLVSKRDGVALPS